MPEIYLFLLPPKSILRHEFRKRYILLILHHIRKLLPLFIPISDLLHKLVLEQLLDRPPFSCVFLEAFLDEVAVGWGEFHFIQPVGVLGGDEVHGLQGRHPEEGGLALGQFHCDDTD